MSLTEASLGFTRDSASIANGIYIPRYYEPRVLSRLHELEKSHNLVRLGDLIAAGAITVHYGHDIGKHHYGNGDIPYVRTSDLATWEVVAAPKQTVSKATYEQFQARQDVRAEDILFIRDGLYLIGRAALITEHDLPLIHQSHLIRFRVHESSPISAYVLLAVLSAPVVRWQVRSKQFTAGIIDKIEDRFLELMLPVPKDTEVVTEIDRKVRWIVHRRAELRGALDGLPRRVHGIEQSKADFAADSAVLADRSRNTLLGYVRASTDITEDILLPKYYSPAIEATLEGMSESYQMHSIRDLEVAGIISLSTGLEVGKLAYGQGDVPFIRTSDLANWELAGQPKQLVSEALYDALQKKIDLQADDILLVRDGTYLVGASAILTEADARALYAGGLYRLRVLKPEVLDPYLLLTLLNSPIVKLQMKSKQFTRDIIDTLGRRLGEVVIPIPLSSDLAAEIASAARSIVEERVDLRDQAKRLVVDVEGGSVTDDDDVVVSAALAL